MVVEIGKGTDKYAESNHYGHIQNCKKWVGSSRSFLQVLQGVERKSPSRTRSQKPSDSGSSQETTFSFGITLGQVIDCWQFKFQIFTNVPDIVRLWLAIIQTMMLLKSVGVQCSRRNLSKSEETNLFVVLKIPSKIHILEGDQDCRIWDPTWDGVFLWHLSLRLCLEVALQIASGRSCGSPRPLLMLPHLCGQSHGGKSSPWIISNNETLLLSTHVPYSSQSKISILLHFERFWGSWRDPKLRVFRNLVLY